MSHAAVRAQAERYKRGFPDLRPGYTVRVHQKVQEGGGSDSKDKEEKEAKERIQIFEGLIIGVHRGVLPTDATITVRRVVDGVGVEKIFSLCAPTLAKIDVIKVARVRRAKLSFLRGRSGKSARLSERFTTAEEFKGAVAQEINLPLHP